MPTRKKKVAKKTTVKKKPATKKNEVGRPTKYDSKYCEVVIEYMSKGYSKEACAGVIGIAKSTLYEWAKANPEFSNAISIGEAKSQLFWETMGVDYTVFSKNGKQLNGQVFSLNMRNRFGWSDKKEITTEEKDKKKTFAFDLSEEPNDYEGE
jgi:hypothetical protein